MERINLPLGRVSNWFWGDDSFSCAYQFRSRIITLKIQLKEIVWSPLALLHVGWSKRLGWLFVRWIFLFEKHEHTSAKMFKKLAIHYTVKFCFIYSNETNSSYEKSNFTAFSSKIRVVLVLKSMTHFWTCMKQGARPPWVRFRHGWQLLSK